jgi:hypothetical protein
MPMQQLETVRKYDLNGWFEIQRNPISKAGVFLYSGKSIPGADPTKFYNVYRPAEELADPECIESFKLLPWVNDHAMLGDVEGTTPVEQKTISGVIGEQICFDETDNTLYANIKLFSGQHSALIDSGKAELSSGFRCKYQKQTGTFNNEVYDYVQRTIRGNHLASVDEGRVGPDVAVLDGFTFTIDAKEFKDMPGTKKHTKVVATKLVKSLLAAYAIAMDAADDPESSDVPAGELAQLDELLTQATPVLETIAALACVANAPDGEMVPETPVLDEEDDPETPKKKDGPVAAVVKKVAPVAAAAMDAAEVKRLIDAALAGVTPVAAMDAKDMMREIKNRDALATQLSHFVGVFDHSEMTHAEVAAYGAKKLELRCAKGQEVTAVTAYLHNRPTPSEQPASFGMDGKERKPGNIVSKYTNSTGA